MTWCFRVTAFLSLVAVTTVTLQPSFGNLIGKHAPAHRLQPYGTLPPTGFSDTPVLPVGNDDIKVDAYTDDKINVNLVIISEQPPVYTAYKGENIVLTPGSASQGHVWNAVISGNGAENKLISTAIPVEHTFDTLHNYIDTWLTGSGTRLFPYGTNCFYQYQCTITRDGQMNKITFYPMPANQYSADR